MKKITLKIRVIKGESGWSYRKIRWDNPKICSDPSWDRADEVFEQTGTVLPEVRMERKLAHLQKDAVRYRLIEQRMDETGETQLSLTDPDA